MKLMNFVGLRMLMLPLYDEPGDGGAGGGTGVAVEPQGPNNDGSTKPAGGGSEKPVVGAKPGAGTGTPKPDDSRERGILADLAKERRARQVAEQNLAADRAELARERKRVLALSGVEPRTEDDEVNELVRQRMNKLYPGIERLTPDQVDRLLAVSDRADALDAATEHHWTTHGQQMLDGLTTSMTKVLGGQMSERQIKRLQLAYYNECANDAKFLARHEAGDRNLIEEFVKSYEEDFITPGRRAALATETERRRNVPSARDRSVVGPGGKKLDLSKDSDFADAVTESFKKHGGAFGD